MKIHESFPKMHGQEASCTQHQWYCTISASVSAWFFSFPCSGSRVSKAIETIVIETSLLKSSSGFLLSDRSDHKCNTNKICFQAPCRRYFCSTKRGLPRLEHKTGGGSAPCSSSRTSEIVGRQGPRALPSGYSRGLSNPGGCPPPPPPGGAHVTCAESPSSLTEIPHVDALFICYSFASPDYSFASPDDSWLCRCQSKRSEYRAYQDRRSPLLSHDRTTSRRCFHHRRCLKCLIHVALLAAMFTADICMHAHHSRTRHARITLGFV